MTVSELFKQTAQLGFEDTLEDMNRFVYAANRALLQVCRIKPAVKTYTLNHRPLKNAVKQNTFEPVEKTDDLVFEATDVKAYYFEADGNGVALIEAFDEATQDWDTTNPLVSVTLTSDGDFKAYQGFIQNGGNFVSGIVRIRFTGDYFFSVRNVAMYEQLKSGQTNDIPAFSAFTKYDMRTLVSDFMELNSPPVLESDDNYVLNQTYQVEGDSVLLLPYDNKGVYKVLYKHLPTELSVEDDVDSSDLPVDVDEELCSLLPLLIAAYVWVDDEPEKSEYYMNLYRERVAIIEQKKKSAATVKIRNVYGW